MEPFVANLSAVLFLLAFLVVVVCAVVLPIIALVRTRGMSALRARLDRLEERQRQDARHATTAGDGTAKDMQGRIDELEHRLAAMEGAAPVATAPPRRPRVRFRAESADREVSPARRAKTWSARWWPHKPDLAGLEAWVGRHALGWVAVLLLLFATGFFLKYAFENRWIDELGRVTIGVLSGLALCVAGLIYFRRGWRLFSRMLTAAGVVLLYLATFGAFGYYQLIPQTWAAVFLILLVAESLALAVCCEAPAIALMAVIGGLLNPILLHTGRDHYASLFVYLLILNAGTAGLALLRHWHAIGTVSLIGTHVLFWSWFAEHYHPEKLAAALSFQIGLFLLFVAYSLAAHVIRPRKADAEDLTRMVLNALLFAAASYTLLDEDDHAWMGTLALVMAIVYAGLAWLLQIRRRDDPAQLLVAVAVSMGFLAAVFPLQMEAAWIPVGWAVQGLALWWFGLRIRVQALQALGAVFLSLAVARLLVVDTPWTYREPFIPILNPYALPALVVAACVLAAAFAARWPQPTARWQSAVVGLVGTVLMWLVLSVEAYTYFTARIEPDADSVDQAALWRTAQTALSVLWAGYATVVLGLGLQLSSRPSRWFALGLFALTLGKVVMVDMAGLPGLYRVAAFLILSLAMAAGAWGYHRLQRTLEVAR
jgi:uncharacterized membrane protein